MALCRLELGSSEKKPHSAPPASVSIGQKLLAKEQQKKPKKMLAGSLESSAQRLRQLEKGGRGQTIWEEGQNRKRDERLRRKLRKLIRYGILDDNEEVDDSESGDGKGEFVCELFCSVLLY